MAFLAYLWAIIVEFPFQAGVLVLIGIILGAIAMGVSYETT